MPRTRPGAAAFDGLGRLPQDIERADRPRGGGAAAGLGAVGVALGALVGMLLPATRIENSAFGEAADRVRGEATAAIRGGLDGAQDGRPRGRRQVGAAMQDIDRAGIRDEDARADAEPAREADGRPRSPLADGPTTTTPRPA